VALVATATAVVGSHALPAHADNVTGQRISRSEVIARAQFWVYHTPTYNQGGSYDDPDGRNYRTDCSGFVSMAWHLSDAPTTATFPSHSGVSKLSSRSSLQTGDMLDDVSDGHMVLFGGWDNSAHTLFTYYTFGSNPPKKVTGASFSDSTLSGLPTSHYVPYTYNKLFNDSQGTTLETPLNGVCGQTPWWTDNLTGMHDVDLSTDECYRVLTGADGLKYLNAFITVHWRPGSDGSDDSTNNTTAKYDGFEPHVQLQNNNDTKYEYWCSGFAARINDDFTNGDGVGDYVCSVNVYVPAGTWTVDGWIEFDENNDGLSWQGPVYVQGGPSVVFS
jgi:hypothetical protein